MCGVAAAYAYAAHAPGVDREELRAVRDHMAARGPDGEGEWFSRDGRVGLAHRRLAIIDLSTRGHQPMASADGQLLVSFNGEIYNYRELRTQLMARGRMFTSESDTEVLLQLYQEHGTAMLSMLRGMFAFALWDTQRGAMLVARDPLGIKPLYYATGGGILRVASQVKALLQADVDTSPDPAGHAGFFLWGSVPNPWTLYRGIKALPAGHFMWTDARGTAEPQAYCKVSDVLAQGADHPAVGTREEALSQIGSAIRESLQAHLVSDVPVGLFLSGGLDSTLLASMVAAQGVQPRTITLAFSEYAGTPLDETPLAESIAQLLHADHSTVTVRKADFGAEREKLLAAMDQPSIDGVNSWFVARAAASRGLKVALSGLGGDELLGSYPSFRQIPLLTGLAGPLSRVPGLGLVVRQLSAPLVRQFTSPKYAGLLEYGGSTGGAYLLRRALHMPWELPRLMDPDMARAGWSDLQTVARLTDTAQTAGEKPSRLAISALETSWYMRHQLLADADWAGMAHSLEIRTPLADIELIRRCAPWFAAHPSLTKRDVVHAAAPDLPAEILNRPKSGFSVPVREWLGAPSPSTRGLRGWSKYVYSRQWPRPTLRSQADEHTRRVLVSTLAPGNGGVNAMTGFVIRALARKGMEPVIAHYATYSTKPALSVPVFRLGQRRPGRQRGLAYDAREIHGIGTWLPELEFTHYAPTQHWRELMDSCDAFVVVSGNVLAGTAFLETGRPYLAWVATDWEGDRCDRVRHFPWPRRILDWCVNGPMIKRLEQRLLRGGRIVALSEYTAAMLESRAGRPLYSAVLPVPVDTAVFTPRPDARVAGRIGFAGRFNDPRKNIDLLLAAEAQLRQLGHDVTAVLIGDAPDTRVTRLVAKLGLGGHVAFRPGLSRLEMRDCLQTLDVFILPSHQEGLCISALEAMACGVPVVSTRCGGPQEFVLPGVTGDLVDSSPRAMAHAVASILDNPVLRERMSQAARRLVEERYSQGRAEEIFWQELVAAFPDLAPRRRHTGFSAPLPLDTHASF